MLNKWEYRFLNLAKEIASYSKDTSTKVGAVITDQNNKIISVGYNGFPRGMKDDDRINDRELKYNIIIHAEINAIISAKSTLEGCIIYTYPFQPCSRCASIVVESGIKKVVSIKPSEAILERWEENLRIAKMIFDECGVELLILEDNNGK